MQDKQPLYVEPEARDAVTDAAAAITAAATAAVPVTPDTDAGALAAASSAPRPAKPDSGTSEHLTLAERLGLRAPGGPREGDDEQEVGPTK